MWEGMRSLTEHSLCGVGRVEEQGQIAKELTHSMRGHQEEGEDGTVTELGKER